MKKVILIVGAIVVVAGVVLIGRGRAQEKAGEASGLSSAEQDSVATTAENVDATPSSHFTADTKSDGDVASTKEPLSAPVKALLLQDGKKHNYSTLLAEISKLGYELSDADVAALMDMLAWPNDRFPEKMRSIEINAVKNDVLDKLLRQETLPEGLGSRIAEMAGDAAQDAVWRDYCVQFMGPCYERLTTEYTEYTEGIRQNNLGQNDSVRKNFGVRRLDAALENGADGELTAKGHKEPKSQGAEGSGNYSVHNHPAEKEVVREAMFSALDERDSTIAGTALIGLENLSRTHGEFDRKAIVNSALDIASDESASAASRMTALRLAASGNLKPETGNLNPEVAETARLLAQTGETVLLRSAAIVTLGEIGSADDRELLESYLQDTDRQIAEAAKLALEKLGTPDVPVVDLSQPTVTDDTAPAQPESKLPPVLIN